MKYLQICIHSYLGKNSKLAKKPKPWRISLLVKVVYGGLALIREMALSVSGKCTDSEYLTLVNLLDNYVPLVLSINSIIYTVIQMSDLLYGLNATKPKKVKEQERCETLDKGCEEIQKYQSSTDRICSDKS